MNRILAGLLVVATFPLHAQGPDTLQQSPPPTPLPIWTLIVPGATYYYNGRVVEGLVFTGIETGGIVVGLHFAQKLKSNSSSPYYNYPLYLGMKAMDVELCDWARNRLNCYKDAHPEFKYDQIPEADLFLAPFRSENVFTLVTLGLVGIAGLELLMDGRKAAHGYGSVREMYLLDHYVRRDPAMAVMGSTSLAMSWSAGVSEEYLFRNGVMPFLDYRYGRTKGLCYSSAAFGLLHLSNLAMAEKPKAGQVLGQVVGATAIGFVLGEDVHERNYSIGPAVAAHTWYDFTLMLGSFLVDPENNVFAVQVRFSI